MNKGFNLSKLNQLLSILTRIPQETYASQSRIHRLGSFDTETSCCFIKRDDELSFGLSGSKIRKYRSLIPYLLLNDIKEVILIGSAHSNHILSIIQLLIENKIQPTLFLKQSHHLEKQGNFLLTSLFVDASSIHWIAKQDWAQVKVLAEQYAQQSNKKMFILVEGGSTPEALPGALSLPIDILRNEAEIGLGFDHLFIDSGTGMMASSLILAYQWLEKPTSIHVILMAENEPFFLNQLKFFHQEFEKLVQASCPFPKNFILHKPKKFSAFGSTALSLFKEIKLLARSEGFLADPIYTAKLLIEAKQLLIKRHLEGNILLNHSGGALTLAGFQKSLQNILE